LDKFGRVYFVFVSSGGGPCHGDRQHANKFGKTARVVLEICSQTDTHTQTCSLQYFATAPTGEISM